MGAGSKSGPDRSAPIVRVEIYIRRRFLKLALHHFDGCHPRRGAWGLCQQRGTSQGDGQSGEFLRELSCDTLWRRLTSGGSHTGHDRCMKPFTRRAPLKEALSAPTFPPAQPAARCFRCGAIPNNRHAGSSVQSWSDGRGVVEWATDWNSAGALCDRAVTAGGRWRAALSGQKLR